jgi:formyltetrahydrofolate deformylase
VPSKYILTLLCPDRPGIVHAVCRGLLDVGGNIIENAQFGDEDSNMFCMRTEFETANGDVDAVRRAIETSLGDPSAVLSLRLIGDRPRVMIMVSKFDHCLLDLLYRWRSGNLRVDIPVIVSNHPDCASIAEWYGIPYAHLPVGAANRPEQEAAIMELVQDRGIDLVVLARYMQILSTGLCERLSGRAINIHHSFLPGFKGARPYHQAHERGVKLVGATAHFVTGDLDEGPIIEQDVARVDHAHTVEQLTVLGRDIERMVLSKAVGFWAENRVLLVGNKTVVFR